MGDSLQIKAYIIKIFSMTYKNRLSEKNQLFVSEQILMGYSTPLGFQYVQRKKSEPILLSFLIFV